MNREGKPIRECRIGLYARVSSEKQAEEETIASQLFVLQERIKADGGVLDPALCFVDDGLTGKTFARPALERLRDLAAAGAMDRLYVLEPDRLARKYAHQMVLVEELQACGVEVVFTNRALGATPEDLLLLQMQGMIAEYEHAKILERTRRGRVHAARCGRISVLSRAAFGYRYIDKHTGGGQAAWEVVEEEASVVRQIFDWVGHGGCSLREVARRLQQQGVRTRRGHSRWDSGTIAGMLHNPAYYGQAAFGKTRRGERRPRCHARRGQPETPKYAYSVYQQPASEHIPLAVPALVDIDLFGAAQDRLAENRQRLRERRRGPGYLLQGLLVCGSCGYALSGHTVRGKYTYYGCAGSYASEFASRRVCPNRAQRTEDLEAAVWGDACALLREPERLRQEFERRQQSPEANRTTAEKESLQASITKVKGGINRLIDAYTTGLVETKEFEPRIRSLKERLAKLEKDLQLLIDQKAQAEELRLAFSRLDDFADQMKEGLMSADWGQRREILRALIKRVEVDNESIRIVYKVPHHPFAKGPGRGLFQGCGLRQRGKHEENVELTVHPRQTSVASHLITTVADLPSVLNV
jgi:site-specific DNA recombinase